MSILEQTIVALDEDIDYYEAAPVKCSYCDQEFIPAISERGSSLFLCTTCQTDSTLLFSLDIVRSVLSG